MDAADFEKLQRLWEFSQASEPWLQVNLNSMATPAAEGAGREAMRRAKVMCYLMWRMLRRMGATETSTGAVVQFQVGCALHVEGKYGEAARWLEKATHNLRGHLGLLNEHYMIALFHRVRTLHGLGRQGEVLPEVEECIDAAQQAGLRNEALTLLEEQLGAIYLAKGERVRGQRLLQRVLAEQMQRLGRDARPTLETMLRLATTLDLTRELPQLKALLAEVFAVVNLHPGRFWADRVREHAHHLAAEVAAHEHDLNLQAEHLQAVIALQKSRARTLDPTTAGSYLKLAANRLEAAAPAEAYALLAELQAFGGGGVQWMAPGERRQFHELYFLVAVSLGHEVDQAAVFRAHLESTAEMFRDQFPGLAMSDRLPMAQGLWTAIRQYLAFLVQTRAERTNEEIARAYELVMEFKGVVASSLCIAQERRLAALFPAQREALERLAELRRHLQGPYAEVFHGLPENERERLAGRLRFEKHAIETRLRAETPEVLSVPSWSVADAAEALAALDPESVMVDFVRAEHGTGDMDNPLMAVFVLPAGRPDLLLFGSVAEIGAVERAVENWRDAIRRGEDPDDAPLWELVWQPIEGVLSFIAEQTGSPVRRLFVLPDDKLHWVPFAALRAPAGDGGSFLVDRYNMSYLGSARDLAHIPDLRVDSNAGKALCIGVREFGGRLAPLPFAGKEARDASRWLGAELWPPDCSLTRTALRARLGHIEEPERPPGNSPHVLHFSTHTETLSKDSTLGLALPNETLTPEDISGFDLRHTRLVVLSACDSGAGRVLSGEGLFGLQRGFHTAGAKALLFSLWSIDDAATRELMDEFYSRLMEGLPVAESLRAAQCSMKEGIYGARHCWGAFVLSGNPLSLG